MRKLTFRGHSDDIFAYDDTHGGGDESYSDEFLLTHGDDSMLVIGSYRNNGCWMVGVCQVDEDVPLPSWSMSLGAEGYSATLTIHVPENLKVEAT